MPVIYSNNASTTLSAGINNSTTTIGIASANGFPSIGSGEYYFATIANTNNTKIEVVKVTAGTTSLTVTRAQDGTTAQAFDSGDNFQLRVTAATLEAATKTDVNITGGSIATAAISDDAVTADKLANSINTDIATGVAALPKAGGAMTGAITSASDLNFDVASDIVLDADGGKIKFRDNGDDIGYLQNSSGDLIIKSITDDKDIKIQGKDGGSFITALSLDMSDAGKATFNSDVYSSTGNFGLDAGDYIKFTADTQTDFYVNGNNEMRLEADGDLHVDGDVIAFSTTTASSIALKDNVNVIDNALEKLNSLRGVSFNYKHDGRESAGVIAEDVQQVLPQAVKHIKPTLESKDKSLGVNYGALTSILIEAIKELTAKVEKLEKK